MTDHIEVTSGASSSRPAPNPYDRAHGTEVKPGERCVVRVAGSDLFHGWFHGHLRTDHSRGIVERDTGEVESWLLTTVRPEGREP
jgi:hypothetical protein